MIEIVLEIHDGTEHVQRRPCIADSVPQKGDIFSHVTESDVREYEVIRHPSRGASDAEDRRTVNTPATGRKNAVVRNLKGNG
jgi:hypothetical protein